MRRGDGLVGQDHIIVVRPPDVHDWRLDGQSLPLQGPALDDKARQGTARWPRGSGRCRSRWDAVHGFAEARVARGRRHNGRDGWDGRGGRDGIRGLADWWGCLSHDQRIGVEPELLFSDRDHVGSRQQALPLEPNVVDRCPVRAGIDQQVSLWSLDDLGMAAGNVLARNNYIARGVTTEHQRRPRDGVLAAVRQRYDAPTRVAGGLASLSLPPRLCLGRALL